MGLFNFFKPRRLENVKPLYNHIITRIREPAFYQDFIADDFEGRYELLMLHIYLVLRALRAQGEGRGKGQDLFDLFFGDMDQVLREMGVGDLSVGKKIRKMAEAFYGRTAAYDEAFSSGDLAAVIGRNFFPDSEVTDARAKQIKHFVSYIEALETALRDQEDLFKGNPFLEVHYS